MHTQSKILKWGNSLALRLSGPLRDIPDFRANMIVDIEITEKGLTIHPIKKPKSKKPFPYSESELLEGLSSYKAHSDALPKLSSKEMGD